MYRDMAFIEAQDLPRERTSWWVIVLVAAVTAAWVWSVYWQMEMLPDQVLWRDGNNRVSEEWKSTVSAVRSSAFFTLVFAYPYPLVSLLVLPYLRMFAVPNAVWWSASGPRLRRMERLVREDLWILSSWLVVGFTAGNVVRVLRNLHEPVPLVLEWLPVVAIGLEIVTLLGRFNRVRYATRPGLDGQYLDDEQPGTSAPSHHPAAPD